MLQINRTMLAEVGLENLPGPMANKVLQHTYKTLEMRVGMRLVDQMTDAQLDEFETYFDAGDDAGALSFLAQNFPHYQAIVREELERLKGELVTNSDKLLAAARGAEPAQAGA